MTSNSSNLVQSLRLLEIQRGDGRRKGGGRTCRREVVASVRTQEGEVACLQTRGVEEVREVKVNMESECCFSTAKSPFVFVTAL